jgi:2,3-diketo-5-methylthio-1-phosphopentane phosphatase
MTQKKFKIFIDFDGTISKIDIGEAVFEQFGDKEKVDRIIKNLLEDKITAKECWIALCETAQIPNKAALDNFIDSIEIDRTFHNLINYCKENNFDYYVLSDGFDYYIDRIFLRENLTHIPYFSNKLTIDEDIRLIPFFPYIDENCLSSANCKRNHVINHSGDDDFTVYIGDGNSDKSTVEFCDFIFAKHDLLRYCEKERITFFPYNNFDDVITRLETLKTKKRLKKRHRAELKRREAYLVE